MTFDDAKGLMPKCGIAIASKAKTLKELRDAVCLELAHYDAGLNPLSSEQIAEYVEFLRATEEE